MQYVRLTATPDRSVAPEAFRTIAASPDATEARLLDWNVGGGPVVVALFRIHGDRNSIEGDLAAAPEVDDVDCTAIDEERFHALVTLDTATVSLVRSVFEALLNLGVVVVKPVVYRDGEVHATFVGDGTALGTVLDSFPPAVDVTVHRVGAYRNGVENGAVALSERQREAVFAALDLGYYAVPSEATHEDVADRLGCAASTATEHLQKAEAKLVRGVMDAENEGVREA
jgi:predicted DNA binding protein